MRPDFGYLDHPPMVAWLIALAEALFGHGEASIRIVSLVCGLGVVGFVTASRDVSWNARPR